ncbi:D-alanyl-D-alanine carboxypeptidase family protein [Thomasclavelia cocleata]|jgi:D-alanyl-D-alanine carboxypeptidase (penicillin-binding protein 5/6)|uniref:D-alanyl-D-alanine carboxypeptidase family protein n=1 Tax=Thomasclavelia cocleata TaxID=69824 RepID=UPI00241D14C0|nr:D-alanyl-D-alanine carboxypeptidase family protein [Thomasclavelia cocleata]
MFKKVFSFILTSICLFALITPIQAQENSENIGLTAQYAVAIDAKSGLVLYNKNMDERMYPASMTKVMTVIVAIEMMESLDTATTITQSDIDTVWETGASSANFEVGEAVTYYDLLLGAILPSGADATRALANNLCGGQEAFVDKMNETVKKLKLKDTNFVNTTGIHDPNHYTTVHDMALIVKYAVQNEQFREVYSKRFATSSNGLHQWVNKSMYNAGRSHIDTSNIIGCKSGYTDVAKNCLASLDKVGENEIITVVGKSINDDVKPRAAVQDTLDIVNYVSQNYSLQPIIDKDTEVKKLNIKVAKDNQKIVIKNQHDVTAFLPNNVNKDDLEYKYSFEELEAPVKKGAKIGRLDIYYGDCLLYQEEYVNDKVIERDSFSDLMTSLMNFMFPYGLSIILVIIYFLISKMKKHRVNNG